MDNDYTPVDFDQILDKPFKSIEEQLKILEDRNIDIHKDSPYFAYDILSNYSYYTLINGYKQNLMVDENFYKDGISLYDLKKLYYLDSVLNSIIMRIILIFERKLKTKIAYLVGQKFGQNTDWRSEISDNARDYFHFEHYANNNCNPIFTIKKLKRKIHNIYQDRRLSTTFYYLSHKNHIPPWILVNDLSFGDIISWFRILKPDDKKGIIRDFLGNTNLADDECSQLFSNILKYLQVFRNIAAHGNRNLPNMIRPFQHIPLLCKFYKDELVVPNNNQKELLLLFASIIAVANDEEFIRLFHTDINIFYNKHNNFCIAGTNIFDLLGIPEDLIGTLERLIQTKQHPY